MPNEQKVEEHGPSPEGPQHHQSLEETAEPEGQFPAARTQPADLPPDEHQGATEEQVSDRTGPGAGYDVSAVDESENMSGQSPGAASPDTTPEPKREDPPGPRNPEKREDPPPRRDGTDPPAPRR